LLNYRVIIAVVVILVVVLLLFIIFNSERVEREEKLHHAAVYVAETLVDTLRGRADIVGLVESVGSFMVSDMGYKIKDFENGLKNRPEAFIDLDYVFDSLFGGDDTGTTSPPLADDVGVVGEVEVVDLSGLVSPLVEVVDGRHRISVNNLSFTRYGIAYVLFKGVYLEIGRDGVDETYYMILNNPRYNLRYASNTRLRDGIIDVSFISVYDNSDVLVRLRVVNGLIYDFEVRFGG